MREVHMIMTGAEGIYKYDKARGREPIFENFQKKKSVFYF